ncbi:MAG: hypothetical protein AB7O74_05180 [Candidatus Nanopelagicales bacterium]
MSTAEPHDHLRFEAAREAVTMALYQSLSLLAVLLATPSPSEDDANIAVAVTVFLTGLGLLVAHHIAFRLSSRLINQGLLSDASVTMLKAQAIGGLPIVVGAAIPPLVLGADLGTTVSEVLLLVLVGLVGYRAVRPARDRRQAMGYLVGLLVLVGLLMVLKTAVGH